MKKAGATHGKKVSEEGGIGRYTERAKKSASVTRDDAVNYFMT